MTIMDLLSLVDSLKNNTAQVDITTVAVKSVLSSSLDGVTSIASTATSEQVGFSQVLAAMLSSQSQLIGGLVQTVSAIDVSAKGEEVTNASQTAAFSELQSLFLSEAGLASVFPASAINSSGTTPLSDAEALIQLQQEMLGGLANSLVETSELVETINLTDRGTVDTSNSSVDGDSGDESNNLGFVSNLVQFGFGVNGLDQNDLFDSINVLNHIPLVSDYYQLATDTNISNASKFVGSFIYGGVPGLALLSVEVGVDYFGGYKVKDFVGTVGLAPMLESVEEMAQPIADLISIPSS
jgi:hypothetical protein